MSELFYPTIAYDDNGNTTSSANIVNRYDFENRMTAHGSVTLVYDGNRVSETAGGVTTKYLVDNLNPTGLPQVLDELVNGSVTRTYAYGLQRMSENQLVGSTWTPSFYGYDGHGNVRFLMNTAGAVTDTYQYDAFGMPIASTGTTSNSFRYSGEWSDGSIGLYHLRARYYNQATGRFWVRDPLEHRFCCPSCCQSCSPLPLHPYVYADANPVNRIDPAGTEALEEYELNTFRVEAEEVSAEKLAYQVCVSTCVDACQSILTYDPYVPWQSIAECRIACPAVCSSIFPA